jgi:hypothetical protein
VTSLVVDTNVVLVANGQHQNVSDLCIVECVKRLQGIMKVGKLALDDNFRIIREYQNKTDKKSGNRPGDAFVKWALQNNANTKRVDRVPLHEHDVRSFHSFPDDADLATFDPSDRKFVAVSCAHPGKPPILQATDSKWLDWAEPLKRHGVTIEFLCPGDIARFRANKLGP